MSSDYGHLAQVRDRAMAEPHHPKNLVNVRLDYLDAVLKHYVQMVMASADMKGENAVLRNLLDECAAVVRILEADDIEESGALRALLRHIDGALLAQNQEGKLL